MEVYGNIEALKGAIEKKYSSDIKKAEKETAKKLTEIGKELKEKLELLKARMATTTDAAVKKAYSMVLSTEKIKAKKEFEEKREALIDAVFNGAEKKAKKVVESKEYADYVEKNMPKEKEFTISGSDSCKKAFPSLKVSKNLIGVKFESEGLAYDFTLDTIINSKKDVLRHEVSKVLFN